MGIMGACLCSFLRLGVESDPRNSCRWHPPASRLLLSLVHPQHFLMAFGIGVKVTSYKKLPWSLLSTLKSPNTFSRCVFPSTPFFSLSEALPTLFLFMFHCDSPSLLGCQRDKGRDQISSVHWWTFSTKHDGMQTVIVKWIKHWRNGWMTGFHL